MFISVIIPVYNGRATLPHCLNRLQQSTYDAWECLVVDDGSQDNSAEIAQQWGAQVLQTGHAGPAFARNLGAKAAQGDLLFFLDADVLVQPTTLAHLAAIFTAVPHLAACFGSYDDTPAQSNFLSQYRNLQHHFVHQQGDSHASTFWSGCGAIWRDLFWQVGGFDAQRYPRPSIEDIELGYRLRAAGHIIRLEKSLQVTHLKRWNAKQMLLTDIRDRALPWSALMVQNPTAVNDLNIQTSQRISTAVLFLGLFSLAMAPFYKKAGWFTAVAAASLCYLNRPFYHFLYQKRGLLFLLTAVPWHWLYFFYSGFSFLLVWLSHQRQQNNQASE